MFVGIRQLDGSGRTSAEQAEDQKKAEAERAKEDEMLVQKAFEGLDVTK